MKICKRCGRDFDRKGYFCSTCYRHHRLEQRPELAPKLQGRYSVNMKRVSPDMDDKAYYNTNPSDKLMSLGKVPSEWRGTLRMGLRINPLQRKRRREAQIKGWTGIDPLPMPRVK
jgi:hypothetical protein